MGKGANNQSHQELIVNAFLISGTISDPEKYYHFEIVCEDDDAASEIRDAIAEFGISASVMQRKDHSVVYLKESDSIADMLGILGAHDCLLEFENIRILKEIKENVQRQVNCETANIRKTVLASAKQLDDIKLIKKMRKYSDLPEGLKEAAELRLEYPEMTLSELADMLPGTGRSGLNHRFRRIAKIADELRNEK